MRMPEAIGKLIEYHNTGEDEKFKVWGRFIATLYDEKGYKDEAEMIRLRLLGIYSGSKDATIVK